LAEGFEPPRIAPQLGVSINTVRSHIQGIFNGLGCHTQANAVAIAIRQGVDLSSGAADSMTVAPTAGGLLLRSGL
jgi:hypothetical protein